METERAHILRIDGWLVVDKEMGVSSARETARAKRLFGATKAGHGGTLDPMATGVLPIAFGEATKTVRWTTDLEKSYLFRVCWGEARDTLDREGKVTAESVVRPSSEAIEGALPSFVGLIDQVPPRHSAIHTGGRRAYALARRGEAFELPSRVVRIYAFELVDVLDEACAEFRVRCGKGMYVRSLARDLAAALGTEGHVCALRREAVGPFRELGAVELANLGEIADKEDVRTHLLPLDVVLEGIPVLEVSAVDAERVRHGRTVRLAQVVCDVDGDGLVVARCVGRVVAVGKYRNQEFSPSRVFRV